jgi:ABC-type sugar transport system ATPase subunit
MANVTFRDVSKRFGAVTALDALNLQVRSGEFVALLGPSGSGKSTTLNLLAGLLDPDRGDIFIGDRNVTRVAPDKRDLAMVFQNYALYPHMTLFENIAFPLRAKGRSVGRDEIARRVGATAETLGIAGLLDRYPREISGGQQQRVALGRAMVREPKVFLLDEPLSNLDARLRLRMRRDLKALHARLGSTIVYVTHDQAEAMALSSRIAVFAQGKLQQFGTPAEIYDRPANLFVAEFVGEREINLLHGRLERNGAGLRFAGPGLHLHVGSLGDDDAALAGRSVTLGLRPEAFVLSPEESPRCVSGRVTLTELIGPDLILRVSSGENSFDCRVEPRSDLRVGDVVHLEARADQLHVFDPDTSINLRGMRKAA